MSEPIKNIFKYIYSKLTLELIFKFIIAEIIFYQVLLILAPILVIPVYHFIEFFSPIIRLIYDNSPSLVIDLILIIMHFYIMYLNILNYIFYYMSEVGLNYGMLTFDPVMSILPFFITVRAMSTKATRKTTIQKNMVTLKSLKEELESIKSKHAAVASHTITNDKKGNQTIKTKWSLNPMVILWVISFILSYAVKIPYIGKIVKLLSLWYGRSKWWVTLVFLRKGFVLLNAIIGFLVVCDVTGFGPHNVIAGASGIGPVYLDIIANAFKTTFNWIFSLFDQQIVPKFPDNTSNNGKYIEAFSKLRLPEVPRIENPLSDHVSLRHEPTVVINNYSSGWLGGWGSYVLYALGGAFISLLGYKIVTDPGLFTDLIKGNNVSLWQTIKDFFTLRRGTTEDTLFDVLSDGSRTPTEGAAEGAAEGAQGAASAFFGALMYLPRRITHYTSPRTIMNLFRGDDTSLALEMWKTRQASITDHNDQQYPFKSYHPFRSTFDQWRIYLFHESTAEYNRRIIQRDRIRESWGLPPIVGQPIPGAPTLGLRNLFDFPSFIATLRHIFWLDGLPATPQHDTITGPTPPSPHGSDSSDEDTDNIWDMERLHMVFEKWKADLADKPLEYLKEQAESCEKYYDLACEKRARNTTNYNEVSYAFKKWDTCLELIRELENPSDTSYANTGANPEGFWTQEELHLNHWEMEGRKFKNGKAGPSSGS